MNSITDCSRIGMVRRFVAFADAGELPMAIVNPEVVEVARECVRLDKLIRRLWWSVLLWAIVALSSVLVLVFILDFRPGLVVATAVVLFVIGTGIILFHINRGHKKMPPTDEVITTLGIVEQVFECLVIPNVFGPYQVSRLKGTLIYENIVHKMNGLIRQVLKIESAHKKSGESTPPNTGAQMVEFKKYFDLLKRLKVINGDYHQFFDRQTRRIQQQENNGI